MWSVFALALVVWGEVSVVDCERIVATIDGRGSSSGERFSVAWASPGNTVVAADDPYRVRGRAPGFYFLTVTDQVNGCFTMDSVELIREAIQITGFSLAVDQPACEQDRDGMVEITAIEGGTAPFRYRLDDGLLTGRTAYDGLPIGPYDL